MTLIILGGYVFTAAAQSQQDGRWIHLFDGKSLSGWKASEHPSSFSVDSGRIVAHGPRAHLYYTGPVGNHVFRNFELKAEIMTTPGSNSGIYFHTRYDDHGWPSSGQEVQINNTYRHDFRRTGSLYGLDNVRTAPVDDGKWFTMHIRVDGKQVTVSVNDSTLVSHALSGDDLRRLGSGTIALQAHDPDSKVCFRNIRIKILDK